MLAVLAILSSFLSVVSASSNAFIADFGDAGLENSFFQMTLDGGSANYEYKLDLTNLETSCDLTQGLTYHVHSFWTDETASASISTCGDAGGHFDPYLACGPSSQDASGLCPLLSRTADQGYEYACTAERFSAGHHAECEVGDLSGKFGRMMPSKLDANTFIGFHEDPNPPIMANYGSTDAVANQWASVVLHCPADNSRVLCGKMVQEKC